mgnify:CR=1 FL=1
MPLNKVVHSSIALRFISPITHHLNESHSARLHFVSSRWCGIRRIKKESRLFSEYEYSSLSLLFFFTLLIAYAQRKVPPQAI